MSKEGNIKQAIALLHHSAVPCSIFDIQTATLGHTLYFAVPNGYYYPYRVGIVSVSGMSPRSILAPRPVNQR